ncbi:MAG: hypothetical protein ACJ8J7_02790, partial [Sulfurifustaceae bacterium]
RDADRSAAAGRDELSEPVADGIEAAARGNAPPFFLYETLKRVSYCRGREEFHLGIMSNR